MERAKDSLKIFLENFEAKRGYSFNSGQIEGVKYIIASGDFALIEGWAGTGKSTMMEAVKVVYEDQAAFKSQGGTYKESFVLVDSGLRKEDSYVSMSRQSENIRLFVPKSEVRIDWKQFDRNLTEKELKNIRHRSSLVRSSSRDSSRFL